MVIINIQSFSFVYFSLGLEKHSFVIIVPTLVKKEIYPVIKTPKLVSIPAKHCDVPTVNKLTPITILEIPV